MNLIDRPCRQTLPQPFDAFEGAAIEPQVPRYAAEASAQHSPFLDSIDQVASGLAVALAGIDDAVEGA